MESKSITLVKQDNGIFVLTMKAGENRFNPTFMADFHKALDIVEKSEGATALVTTGVGKFYSNGLDLDWMTANPSQSGNNIIEAMKLMGRMLIFPVPTIAALNGHAFAAGMMLALAHDYRVMRDDRGFLCLPEVDLHMPFAPGMNSIIVNKIGDPLVLREAMLLGKRFNAKESLKLKLVDVVASEKEVLNKSIEIANAVVDKGDDKITFGMIKSELYQNSYKLLTTGGLGLGEKLIDKIKAKL